MAWLKREANSPNWYLCWRVEGRSRKRSTGTRDRRLAERILKAFDEELALDRFGVARESGGLPVADAIARYLQFVAEERSRKTYQGYRRTLKIFAAWQAAVRPAALISMLTAGDIDEFYRARRRDRGRDMRSLISDNTLAIDGRQLKAFFNWTKAQGWVTVNPVQRIPQPKKQSEHAAFMSERDVEQLLAAEDRADLRELYRFMLLTGCRATEATMLSWERIRLDHQLIYFSPEFRKRGIRHAVEISMGLANLIGEMRDRREKGSVACTGRVWCVSAAWASRKFRQARRRAKLPKSYHLHTLRHTAASHLIMAGVPMKAVAEILGCGIAMIEQHYGHLATGFKAKMLDASPLAKFGGALPEKPKGAANGRAG